MPNHTVGVIVTFFTKADCSLCDAALFVVEKVRQQIPFDLQRVDITAPGFEITFRRYCHDIPVIHINGREVFRHRVDERTLRRELLECIGRS